MSLLGDLYRYLYSQFTDKPSRFGMVYQRITDIYLAMQDKLKTAKIDNLDELLNKFLKEFYSDEDKNQFPDPFEDFGLFNDLKKVGYTHVFTTQRESENG